MKRYPVILCLCLFTTVANAQTMAEYERIQRENINGSKPKVEAQLPSSPPLKQTTRDVDVLAYRSVPQPNHLMLRSIDVAVDGKPFFDVAIGQKVGSWLVVQLTDELAVFASAKGKKSIRFREVLPPEPVRALESQMNPSFMVPSIQGMSQSAMPPSGMPFMSNANVETAPIGVIPQR